MQIETESDTILLAFGLLLAFGMGYAFFVQWLRNRHYIEGSSGLLVVGGVLATLILSLPLHQPDRLADFLMQLAAFGLTGTPMVLSQWLHYARQRETAVARLEAMQRERQ